MSADTPIMITSDLDPDLDVTELMQSLVARMQDPSRFFECYYWSQEPGVVECIRALLALPADARVLLEVFLAAAVARDTISASIDAAGALKLYSPEAKLVLSSLAGLGFSGASPRVLS
jgi:hypothetical protein